MKEDWKVEVLAGLYGETKDFVVALEALKKNWTMWKAPYSLGEEHPTVKVGSQSELMKLARDLAETGFNIANLRFKTFDSTTYIYVP